MKTVIIDCKKLKGHKRAHGYLKKVFGFPEYYGGNLDALYDCLTEVGECKVVLKNRESLPKSDGYGKKILAVIEDAGRDNERFTVDAE